MARNTAALGTLAATLTDPDGTALPGVVLTVTSDAGPPLSRITDPEGRATFYNLPAAETTVRAEMEGFEAATETLDVKAGETATAEITLTPHAEDEDDEAGDGSEEEAGASEDDADADDEDA